MVSEQALARKKKFAQIKAEAGNNIRTLRKTLAEREWRVWFFENGEIITFTQDHELVPKENWLTYDFTQEQLSILIGKNINEYVVKKDPLVDNLYSIEVKTIEKSVVSAEQNFLIEIVENRIETFDVLCELFEDRMNITLNNQVLDSYKEIDPEKATVNQRKKFIFYFTAKNDPHILLAQHSVYLKDLLTEKTVTVNFNDVFSECSVYTKKLFNNYKLSRKV